MGSPYAAKLANHVTAAGRTQGPRVAATQSVAPCYTTTYPRTVPNQTTLKEKGRSKFHRQVLQWKTVTTALDSSAVLWLCLKHVFIQRARLSVEKTVLCRRVQSARELRLTVSCWWVTTYSAVGLCLASLSRLPACYTGDIRDGGQCPPRVPIRGVL